MKKGFAPVLIILIIVLISLIVLAILLTISGTKILLPNLLFKPGPSPVLLPPVKSVQKSPQPTPANVNPRPGALNVRDIFATPVKYTDQKVKIQARIDIHTSSGINPCPINAPNCMLPSGLPQGTIYLKDIAAAEGNTSNEIELGEKSRTDPSGYIQFGCSGANLPITTCAGYTNGNLTELEGTLVRFPTDGINQFIYMLVI